jgi:hypothetical protein
VSTYRHDPGEDKIVREVKSIPPAPDIANGQRTKHFGAEDEKDLIDGDLISSGDALAEYDRTPGRREAIVKLTEEIKSAETTLEHRQDLMRAAQQHLCAFEYHARHHHRPRPWWRFGSERLLIAVMATAETLLAYAGFKLAVPEIGQGGHDSLLHFIARNGALMAAIAVGITSACTQFALGRQLARASRGVLLDPTPSTGLDATDE